MAGVFDEMYHAIQAPLWAWARKERYVVYARDIDINIPFLAIQTRDQRICFRQNPATPRRAWDRHLNRFNKIFAAIGRSPVVLEFNSSLVEELQRSDIDQTLIFRSILVPPFSCFFISAEDIFGFPLSNADGKLKHAVGFFLDYAWMPFDQTNSSPEKNIS